MNFSYPYMALLPLLFGLLYLLRRRSGSAVRHPQAVLLRSVPPSWRLRLRRPLLALSSIILVLSLSAAAARPYTVRALALPELRRNIMLTIDVSGSMRARDFVSTFGRASRLDAVKLVVSKFIGERKRDRIGLVVFGGDAYLQSPLTNDHAFLIDMMRSLQVGMAGEDTAIGDGIGLSLKRIQDIEAGAKTVILLTDGANHTGQVNPLKAAQIAHDLGIKIHTIGIGTTKGFMGQPAEFDEETLKQIADITGGIYFNAFTMQRLEEVYGEIDKLESTADEEPEKEVRDELFPIFAWTALAAYLFLLLFSRGIFLKLP